MRRHLYVLPAAIAALVSATVAVAAKANNAEEALFVTELDAFRQLAPCAASAVSWGIHINGGNCGSSPSSLRECICDDPNISDQVKETIGQDLSSSCGNYMTEDLSSASLVFSKYCDPSITVAFPTPTTNIVNAYITDLAEMRYLAPCASDALAGAVMAQTNTLCPADASLFAPCVCNKPAATDYVWSMMSSSARYYCSNAEDVESAWTFFGEYCAMNDGTTKFATPPPPPGFATFYITDLPDFKFLNSCAQSGLINAVQEQKRSLCGSGPGALASCVCLKSGMSGRVSRTLTSEVKYYCDNTAIQHVSSASEVLSQYCAVAQGEYTIAGMPSVPEVWETAAQTQAGVESGGPRPTGSEPGAEGQESGKPAGGSSVKIIVIAVSCVAGFGLLAIGLLIYIRRRRRQAAIGHETPDETAQVDEQGGASAGGDEKGTKSPGVTGYYSPGGKDSEISELPSQMSRAEMDAGGGGMPHSQQVHEMHVQGRDGWQVGPVYEMYAEDPRAL